MSLTLPTGAESHVNTLSRSRSGISGLDAVLHGGFPTGRATILVGSAGSGKTILALQYLFNGAARFNENGLFITFEESEAAIRRNIGSMAWSTMNDVEGKVHVLDARVADATIATGAYDLSGLIAIIESLVKTHSIKRLVLDGIDGLFVQTNDKGMLHRELFRLLNWLEQAGLTTLITAKNLGSSEELPPVFELAEFLAGSIVRLDANLSNRSLKRNLTVLKLRGGSYATGEHPYVINERGIDIPYDEPNPIPGPAREERLPTGIERLDRMLDGGYRAGTVTLISGLPGTGKSTIAGSFAAVGCALGHRVLFVAYESSAGQVELDLRSVGLEIGRYRREGLLALEAVQAASLSADEHYVNIRNLIEEHKPEILVVDSISALRSAGGRIAAEYLAEGLANLGKVRGITTLMTATVETVAGEAESTSTQVSAFADNWIHLSFALARGERNRTLSIVKSRGTAHSNQLRELIFTDTGIVLEDVYSSTGDVLLGTARLEREQQDLASQRARRAELDDTLSSFDERAAKLTLDVDQSRRELESIRRRRGAAEAAAQSWTTSQDADALAILEKRGADPADLHGR